MLGLASVSVAGELTEAAKTGNLARVEELLAKGTPPDDGEENLTPLFRALLGGHAEVAFALASHGGTVSARILGDWLEAKYVTPGCLRAIRLVVRRGNRDHAVAAAGLMWTMGPGAASETLAWLDGESSPQEREVALLALRRAAGDNKDVLSVLAAREDAYESLGWNGWADPVVVRRLAQGVAEGRDDALLACTRIRWPRVPEEAQAAAITELRKALGKAREKGKLKQVDDILLALSGKAPEIAGHPVGRLVRRSAGSRSTPEEKAVEAGLRWLATQQDKDEGWWGAPEPLYKEGVTALAVLAFLGAGHYPYGGTEYAPNVEAGLRYLLDAQADDGVLGTRATRKFMYNHAIATLALCEATHFCGHPLYEQAASKAAGFLVEARNPGAAWRYDPRGGENDTSVTSHCLHALHVASLRDNGIEVRGTIKSGVAWLDKMGDRRIGYDKRGGDSWRPKELEKQFPGDCTRAMTAAGTFCRLLLEENRGSDAVKVGVDECTGWLPRWHTEDSLGGLCLDMYYWYWGTLALHQFGGKSWRDWWERAKKEIVPNQLREGPDAGSWPPLDPWASDGGRAYATAMMVLVLETPYRYARAKGVR